MEQLFNFKTLTAIIMTVFLFAGCSEKIVRSGVIVDEQTNEPLQGVSIDIYLKWQRKDSLQEKVLTDENGRFFINEKRDKELMFELNKNGYVSHVNSLAIENDTIRLERTSD